MQQSMFVQRYDISVYNSKFVPALRKLAKAVTRIIFPRQKNANCSLSKILRVACVCVCVFYHAVFIFIFVPPITLLLSRFATRALT